MSYITKFTSCVALSVVITNPLLCADSKKENFKSHITFSPHGKEKSVHYEGVSHIEEIKGVKVSSCISLGDGCIDRLNHILKDSNEFIVSFMYRFNSPTLLKTLKNKHLENVPVVTFLDYTQTYESSSDGSNYQKYVQKLIDNVPTSLVKLKNRPFHHKITIAKSVGKEAIVIIGSANDTFESDNVHSEDLVFIQSNKLALFYLNNFQFLLRMAPKKLQNHNEPIAEIYHEHKLPNKTSNTEALSDFMKKVSNSEQVNMEGFSADIVSAGISSGGNSSSCIDILNDVLSQKNEFLFMFENYISLDETLEKEKIGKELTNNISKYIVLDKNKHNRKSENFLKKGNNNKILLFKPFSGGKFHHKLIISYPESDEPIVYTGSFHVSKSSIKRNSEDIIGIKSAQLADKYLADILENSGLGEILEIWKFINLYPRLKKNPQSKNTSTSLIFEKTEVSKVARKIQMNCTQNMARYADRLDRIHDDLEIVSLGNLSVNQGADKQIRIQDYFDNFQRDFSEPEPLNKLVALENLKEYIFQKELKDIFLKNIKENSKPIQKAYNFMRKFPTYENILNIGIWLEEVDDWIKYARKLQVSDDEINEDIEEPLSTIETVYAALYDLETYVTSFKRLYDLHEILENITGEN